MKKIVFVFLALSGLSVAEDLKVHGPIFFRGKSIDGDFVTRNLVVSKINNGIKVKLNDVERSIITELDFLRDAVVGKDRKSFALMVSGESASSYELHTVQLAEGIARKYAFEEGELTEEFGWVIEIGSVSEDGRYLLLKCAKFFPPDPKTNIKRVSHEWIIAEVDGGRFTVLVQHSGIDEWHKYRKL